MENLETRCCSHVAQTRQASYYCSEEVLSKTGVAFRAKCKIFSRHLQKPILKTEKGRFKGL